MKKILIISFLFVSLFTEAQNNPLIKPSTVQPFGWIDARTFGVVADSSTDCTTFMRNALAEAGRYHTKLIVPSGNIVVSDSLIILPGVTVSGAGGNGLTNDVLAAGFEKSAGTNILFRTANKNCFVVAPSANVTNITGFNIDNINIVYQGGGTPSSGSGIYVINGGNYTLEKVGVRGFYDNIRSTGGSYWMMHNCWIGSYAHTGLTITNLFNADYGDMAISDCFFYSGGSYPHPFADLYWKSSGGMKISNSKFNVASLDTSKNKMFGIYMDNSDGVSIDMFFNNLSIEGFDSSAISGQNLGGGMRHFLISNVQTYTITKTFAPAVRLQWAAGSPTILNGGVAITNLVSFANGQDYLQPVVLLEKASNIMIGGIVNYYYKKPSVQYNNCGAIYETPYVHYINGSSTAVTQFSSQGELDLMTDSSVVSGGSDPFKVFVGGNGSNGVATALFIDSLHRTLLNGTARVSNNAWLEVRKDTNQIAEMIMVNENTGTASTARVQVFNGAGRGYIQQTSTGWTPYKSIGANTFAIYTSASPGMAILADGGPISINNLNQHGLFINSTNASVGVDNSGATSLFEVGGNIVNQATNSATGNMFAVRNNLIGNTSTAISGTVAQYALSGFGANSCSASNTGVTYTNASTIYIAGAPTASTNVTITNPWAFYVNAGNSFLGGTLQVSGNSGLGTAPLTTAAAATGIAAYNSTYGTGLVTSAGTSNDAITAGSGTVATMAANRVQIPTFTATNTLVTYTNSFNWLIDGAVTSGTHVTQTNPYAFGVLAGNSGFGGHLLPLTTITYDLGSASLAWRDIYFSHTISESAIGVSSSLGSNVSSLTPSGSDEDFQMVLVTSGAVAGTLGVVTFGRNWGSRPHCVISSADATTGSAIALTVGGYEAFNATSVSQATFSGTITASGTYTFNCHCGQ